MEISNNVHYNQEQRPSLSERFQETAYFQEMAKHRYKIESKNEKLKQRHSFDVARASVLFNMELQATTTILVENMKRIMTLINQK